VRWRIRPRWLLVLTALMILLPGSGRPVQAQQPPPPQGPPVDSIVVEGNRRVSVEQIQQSSGIILHEPINYRGIQRAIAALFRTGQFDDVQIQQRGDQSRLVVAILVKERPILARWAIRGADQLSEGSIRGKVVLVEGRPLDRAAVERARAAIDSLYQKKGFYAARVKVNEIESATGAARLVFDISEGSRVAISQVIIDGNTSFDDPQVVSGMASQPEGFWWFQKGEFSEEKLDQDVRERMPQWYGDRGHIDFQVLRDTLITDSVPGKAILKLAVDEGQQYYVGTFDIAGNRRYSIEELSFNFPFGSNVVAGRGEQVNVPFSRKDWDAATEKVRNLYANTGYIYSRVEPEMVRRTGRDGKSYLDLRWNIQEGSPATISQILIVGNDVTHERVIREQIIMVPGQVFNREALIRSYQNVSNLNFFEQPMPPPDVQPSENGVDVNIVFRVTEKRTGNIQFGASLGQGTGVGGFIGLEEPNLFGQGKRGKIQWQFGRNINDFNLSYTDPAIKESRISGTVSVFNSRQKYTVGDLGRRKQVGSSLQIGLPAFGARYTRLYGTYSYQQISYEGGAADLRARYNCVDCLRSTLGFSVVRDTRIGLPFPVAGNSATVSFETNGGWLGGTGDYNKIDFDGRWYAPLGTLGGGGQIGAGVQLVLGFTGKSGFVLGDAGPFFTELYTMGGVQYGLPLRGYEEFSITPNGFDPRAGGSSASPDAFGKSYASFTVEAGARLSQALYLNLFVDAGNVYRSARQYNPLRLYRSVGLGAAIISPLGPLGIDFGYGLDKVDLQGRPAPGWKLHFRLGNFF
jgi:outer membrane protein insertion porin family